MQKTSELLGPFSVSCVCNSLVVKTVDSPEVMPENFLLFLYIFIDHIDCSRAAVTCHNDILVTGSGSETRATIKTVTTPDKIKTLQYIPILFLTK